MTAKPRDARPSTSTPAVALWARLFWMGIGNILLFLAATLLWKDDGAAVLELSVLYWATVAAIVAVRYVDIRRFNGKTTEGAPATLKHWRRHTSVLVPLAVAVWVAAAFAA